MGRVQGRGREYERRQDEQYTKNVSVYMTLFAMHQQLQRILTSSRGRAPLMTTMPMS